jgi:hypothetical protein
MDFHGINTVGKIWLERINSKPGFTMSWVGRIIFALDTQTLSFGTSGGWVDIASATQGGITNPAIPVGEIILFEKDTAVFGYDLLTDVDDVSIMITKGSVAGGLPGGGDQGLWGHTHGPGTLNADHNHFWYNYIGGGGDKSWQADGVTQAGFNKGGSGDLGICTQADGDKFHGFDFWTQNTSPAISGSTGAPLASWRPKSRNFTRQQKT